MKDRDLLAAPVIGQVVAGDDGVRIVATDGAENIGTSQLGQLRIAGGRSDLQDSCRFIYFGGRDRCPGAIAPEDTDHTRVDELPGGGDRLLGIAEIVRRYEPHLLAKHAARRIDVGHGHIGGALHLLSGNGVLSCHRAEEPD